MSMWEATARDIAEWAWIVVQRIPQGLYYKHKEQRGG